jgi:hypothetical protein
MVKYKSIKKNNFYKKKGGTKKVRKTVNSNLIGGSAELKAVFKSSMFVYFNEKDISVDGEDKDIGYTGEIFNFIETEVQTIKLRLNDKTLYEDLIPIELEDFMNIYNLISVIHSDESKDYDIIVAIIDFIVNAGYPLLQYYVGLKTVVKEFLLNTTKFDEAPTLENIKHYKLLGKCISLLGLVSDSATTDTFALTSDDVEIIRQKIQRFLEQILYIDSLINTHLYFYLISILDKNQDPTDNREIIWKTSVISSVLNSILSILSQVDESYHKKALEYKKILEIFIAELQEDQFIQLVTEEYIKDQFFKFNEAINKSMQGNNPIFRTFNMMIKTIKCGQPPCISEICGFCPQTIIQNPPSHMNLIQILLDKPVALESIRVESIRQEEGGEEEEEGENTQDMPDPRVRMRFLIGRFNEKRDIKKLNLSAEQIISINNKLLSGLSYNELEIFLLQLEEIEGEYNKISDYIEMIKQNLVIMSRLHEEQLEKERIKELTRRENIVNEYNVGVLSLFKESQSTVDSFISDKKEEVESIFQKIYESVILEHTTQEAIYQWIDMPKLRKLVFEYNLNLQDISTVYSDSPNVSSKTFAIELLLQEYPDAKQQLYTQDINFDSFIIMYLFKRAYIGKLDKHNIENEIKEQLSWLISGANGGMEVEGEGGFYQLEWFILFNKHVLEVLNIPLPEITNPIFLFSYYLFMGVNDTYFNIETSTFPQILNTIANNIFGLIFTHIRIFFPNLELYLNTALQQLNYLMTLTDNWDMDDEDMISLPTVELSPTANELVNKYTDNMEIRKLLSLFFQYNLKFNPGETDFKEVLDLFNKSTYLSEPTNYIPDEETGKVQFGALKPNTITHIEDGIEYTLVEIIESTDFDLTNLNTFMNVTLGIFKVFFYYRHISDFKTYLTKYKFDKLEGRRPHEPSKLLLKFVAAHIFDSTIYKTSTGTMEGVEGSTNDGTVRTIKKVEPKQLKSLEDFFLTESLKKFHAGSFKSDFSHTLEKNFKDLLELDVVVMENDAAMLLELDVVVEEDNKQEETMVRDPRYTDLETLLKIWNKAVVKDYTQLLLYLMGGYEDEDEDKDEEDPAPVINFIIETADSKELQQCLEILKTNLLKNKSLFLPMIIFIRRIIHFDDDDDDEKRMKKEAVLFSTIWGDKKIYEAIKGWKDITINETLIIDILENLLLSKNILLKNAERFGINSFFIDEIHSNRLIKIKKNLFSFFIIGVNKNLGITEDGLKLYEKLSLEEQLELYLISKEKGMTNNHNLFEIIYNGVNEDLVITEDGLKLYQQLSLEEQLVLYLISKDKKEMHWHHNLLQIIYTNTILQFESCSKDFKICDDLLKLLALAQIPKYIKDLLEFLRRLIKYIFDKVPIESDLNDDNSQLYLYYWKILNLMWPTISIGDESNQQEFKKLTDKLALKYDVDGPELAETTGAPNAKAAKAALESKKIDVPLGQTAARTDERTAAMLAKRNLAGRDRGISSQGGQGRGGRSRGQGGGGSRKNNKNKSKRKSDKKNKKATKK